MPSVLPFSSENDEAVDGLDEAVVGREVDLEVPDLQEARRRGPWCSRAFKAAELTE